MAADQPELTVTMFAVADTGAAATDDGAARRQSDQLVSGAADDALRPFAPVGLPAPAAVRVVLPVGGVPVPLDMNPLAVPDLLLVAFATGGRERFAQVGRAVVDAAAGTVYVEPRGAGPTLLSAGPPTPATAPVLALQLVGETFGQLNDWVVEIILEIAETAYDIGRDRVNKARYAFAGQRSRYGLEWSQTGRNAPATLGPDEPGKQSDVDGLVKAVSQLVDLRNALVAARASAYGAGAAAGGAEGSSGGRRAEPRTVDEAAEQRIARLESAFLDHLARVARSPEGHPLVPAVFSWLVRGDPSSIEVGEQDILLAAFQYMLDAQDRLGRALPAVFPRAELNGAVRVSEAERLEAAGRSAQDTPEVRAVLWMRRERPGETYQPLDDDEVLAELLSSYANELSGSGDELEELRRLTRYQVLHELVAAREVADHVEAAEVEERARAYEAPMRAAAVVDLLAMLVPPLAPVAAALTVYVLVGNSLVAIDEVARLNRRVDQSMVATLLTGDTARYSMLLASRPTVLGALASQAEQLAMLLLVGKMSPPLGRLLQVLLDLDTALALGLADKLLADSEPVRPP